MDPNLQPQDLITGVCFGFGGFGYDPLTPKLAVHAQYFCSFFLGARIVCVICISHFIIFFKFFIFYFYQSQAGHCPINLEC